VTHRASLLARSVLSSVGNPGSSLYAIPSCFTVFLLIRQRRVPRQKIFGGIRCVFHFSVAD
jgi:hypothetical protein